MPSLGNWRLYGEPPAIVKVTQGAAKLRFIASAKHMELHTITTPLRLFYPPKKVYVTNMAPVVVVVGCYT